MTAIASAARRHQRRIAANRTTGLSARLAARLGGTPERGDVPGWVLITLMTAGLVTVLWALAGDQLETLFSDAIGNVSGPGAP